MDNYKKGKNVEEPLEKNRIGIQNLPDNFLWMHVRGGSKIRNLLTHALGELPNAKHVVWTGFGQSVGKAITCAEIMKRECGNSLYQVNSISYRLVEEYWDPVTPELDQLVVKRKLPMIHILLSTETLDCKAVGYQAPNSKISYEPSKENSKKQGNYKQKKRKHTNNAPK
ncbi:PREDICTED: ribonuclease P protein subunit p25-like protein [Nicrophorus vespilloides]|uniref:Ribonuclease P protein subunit p25-like protein n=1 Tax=Nicrophorus vespilloides TaxID=110193 RepID=A0ABM1MB46_NICVS|nr:PREDICTED: ribonuclease P protein subunit p25-like protein [Nicrophorus vespilloides]